MKFSCMKSELVQVVKIARRLKIAGRSIANESPGQILSGLYLRAENDMLEIQVADYEIGAILQVKVDVETPGDSVVSGRFLYEAIRAIPDEKVTVQYDRSTEIIVISSGKSIFTLPSMDVEAFPKIHPIKDGKQFTVNSTVLKNLIHWTTFACATNKTRPLFMGALLEFEGDKVRMVATNNHRLAFDEGRIEDDVSELFRYVIPKRILEEMEYILSSYVLEKVQVACTQSELSFCIDKIYVKTRLIKGEFPEYRQVIPSEFSRNITLPTVAFLSAVTRVAIIERTSVYNDICLRFNNNEVHISSDRTEAGKAEETMPAVIDGEEIEIAFCHSYLIDVLKIINSDTFIMEMNGSSEVTVIRESDNKNLLHVVRPGRMNHDKH